MMVRIAGVLSLILLLASCAPHGPEKERHEAKETSPVLSSLKDAQLPCFNCHSYEKFSIDEKGKFSHPKHLSFGVHCNQCHLIAMHKEMSLNKNICDSCHKMTSFAFSNTAMPVNFSHQNHAKKFGCSECHPARFQMKRGSTKIMMEDMYKGGNCGGCHDGKKAFSSKECAKCHNMSSLKDFSYPSKDMSPAVFSHQLHTAMFECGNCHASIFKYKKGGSGMKMDDLYANKFCGKCHDGQSAFASSECQRCHK